MRHEHQTIRGSLHQSMQQGHSPDRAARDALGTLDDQRDKWAAMLAAIAAAVGVAASANLIGQFQDAGQLPADYPAYDPSEDDGALSDYIDGTSATASGIVDDTRSSLWDAFKDALTAGTVLALLDAADQQYQTWTGANVDTSTLDGQVADAGYAGRAGTLTANAVTAPWSAAEQDTATDVTAADNPLAPTDANGVQLVAVKTWVCSMLPNSREWHVEADGQQVALDATFSVGGEDLDGPGDGSGMNANNCCCSQLVELAPATYALDSETGGTA